MKEIPKPGTVACRFEWLLDELERRFPDVFRAIWSKPPEIEYIKEIDKLIDFKNKYSQKINDENTRSIGDETR